VPKRLFAWQLILTLLYVQLIYNQKILDVMNALMAPILCLTAEELHHHNTNVSHQQEGDEKKESVFHCGWTDQVKINNIVLIEYYQRIQNGKTTGLQKNGI
jgi:isoleucyl-tRNA synthetase